MFFLMSLGMEGVEVMAVAVTTVILMMEALQVCALHVHVASSFFRTVLWRDIINASFQAKLYSIDSRALVGNG